MLVLLKNRSRFRPLGLSFNCVYFANSNTVSKGPNILHNIQRIWEKYAKRT